MRSTETTEIGPTDISSVDNRGEMPFPIFAQFESVIQRKNKVMATYSNELMPRCRLTVLKLKAALFKTSTE